MATEDARYRQTSQYRLWSFSPSHLASLRQQTNTLAQKHISARLKNANPPVDPLPEFLSPEEEHTLLTHFTVELLRAAAFLKLPTDIQATAAVFLRRFYLTNSIMTYPPTVLLKTCLFFGCKTEGFYFRLKKFADNFPNTTGEEVLAAEYVLAQGIRFAFDVKHPFRALEGAVMTLRHSGDFDHDRINRAHTRTREILKFSPLVTDAYFHYTPSQIMLAALSMADEGLADRIVEDAAAAATVTSSDNSSSATTNQQQQQISATIGSCKAVLEQEPPERMTNYWGTDAEKKATKPLSKKLKKCRDPDRVDLIALQKAKREQALQKPKPNKPNTQQGDADIFGGSLGGGGGGGGGGGLVEPDMKKRKVANSGGGGDPFGPPL